MSKQWRIVLTALMVMMMVFGSSVYALKDVAKGTQDTKVQWLMDKGVIKGDGKMFDGGRKLTNAEGVHLLVKGFDLSLAAFLFIKEPLASDSFTKVPNDAWYSQSFVIAAVNGLDLPRDIQPQGKMTREQFAYHLYTAMMLKGDYPFTKRLFTITDDKQLNTSYRFAIQNLLNASIVELDAKGNFYPKKEITRLEAAAMLYEALQFVEKHTAPIPPDGVTVEDVTFVEKKINDEVKEVKLSWGEKPNAGYSMEVTKVEFEANSAVVYYKLSYPQEGQMYAQVITTPQAVVYVPAGLKVELKAE